MNCLKTKRVLNVILEVAQSIKHRGLMLNERYLHHSFSHLLQNKRDLLNLSGENGAGTLHPEWPTYKKQTKLFYGRYKKENGKYKPSVDGTAGFIDFAIGDYNKPSIGIEFSVKYGWSNEEVVYDFLKLLDKRNPFDTVISLNVIFRQEKLARGRYLSDLERHINDALLEAVNRLSRDNIDISREVYFIITEIDKHNNRRHWYRDKTSNKFKKGLPVIR